MEKEYANIEAAIVRESSVTELSDSDLLELADMKMDIAQNERLYQLQVMGKQSGLTQLEERELLALLQTYQIGQLRKSEAQAEAVRRGLRTPISLGFTDVGDNNE